jgi:hypothetical protein
LEGRALADVLISNLHSIPLPIAGKRIRGRAFPAAFRSPPVKKIENNPMHSRRHQPDQWVTPFPKMKLTRQAKQGQNGMVWREADRNDGCT